ncbi:hypothetical protein GN958_ATG16249 [Phytophthora infestans]|uniref:Uncharacterized protein n=1 Tax=Phytophthora infestans TaxID=4787 RepID=A0A8S9U2S8_PHYIN|nr:hypothetical protein GN958_ATG16249 [Phytophthora infestans]
MATEMTTTEETETTKTVTSEDVRALAHEDVSGDVARSVAERGGYAVSSGCTSGAGTGSSKQATETSEETETFCRGHHYGNGHRDDHDGGNENDKDSDERGRSGDVACSVAERGCVIWLVAERGGYAESLGCTSGAGTGSSKQTTETSEETETFCRGHHYGNGHRDDHDGGNENDKDSDERGRESLGTRSPTEMTTTEETENDGDSDERGLWLNAVATLFQLPVRVARARDRASRQPRRPRRRRRFVEGTTTEMATEMTTTEETESTKIVTSEDVRALPREDVSGDVTRSVAERGGYAVSFGCTSDAGTGSSKQTAETSEETETFCRGYHYGNGHRDDHDGGNGNDGDSDERGLWLNAVATLCHLAVRVAWARDRASRQPRRPRRRRRFVEGTTTEMATEMTPTEETENDKDNSETEVLAREDVRWAWPAVWLNAVVTLCHLAGRVARARIVEQADNRDVRGDGDVFVEGTTTEMATEMTTTEETKNDKDSDERGRESLGTRRRSGDVARSVAERGGYAASFGRAASGAGTGSVKQTAETSSEETETPLSRVYHYGNGHRDDHDE